MRTPTGTSPRRGVVTLAALALVGALAAGCSGSEPKAGRITDTPSPSTPSASSPSATTPEEQIEAAMQAYMAAANEMFRSGDVTQIRKLSTTACPCRKVTRYVERISTDGGEFQGAAYEDISIRVHDVTDSTGAAEVTAKVAPYKVVDRAGKVIENSDGGSLHTDYSLVKQDGGQWIIGNALDLG